MTNPMQSYSPLLSRRILASGAIGNILETYDLILISLMATTLSGVFFPPSANPNTHVIDVLYVFLVGLLTRPLGNIVMSLFADQIGRKKLMVISLISTGIGTIGIGLIPGYDYIGGWSTFFFILLRIIQNFFAGIEYINSASYLLECSNKNNHGFYVSWTAIGISGGYLLASVVALIITYLISNNHIPAWGWRLTFIFSIIGLIYGIWIRYTIPESIIFMISQSNKPYPKKTQILINSFKFIFQNTAHCLSISAITLIGVFLSFIYYIYIPVNLITMRNFTQNEAFSLNVISLSLVVILIPIFGKLSDYYGRIKLLKVVCLSILFLAVPFFWITSYGTYHEILLCMLLISIPSSCMFSIYPAFITENFPPQIRCTTASIVYQIIVSIEMGILPFGINYFINLTSSPYSPGYLLIAITITALLCLVLIKRNKDYNPSFS